MEDQRLKYLKLLAEKYPNATSAGIEIMLQQSILELPKGSELFLSDVHGEHESFNHVLRNGSGIIRSQIGRIFGDELTEKQVRALATLIYYPNEKLDMLSQAGGLTKVFYEATLDQFVRIARKLSSVYAYRKIEAILPEVFGKVIFELVHKQDHLVNKSDYYHQIVQSVIQIEQADQLIIAFAKFIQRLAVHKIHIIGDIFDRGPGAEHIMDTLIRHHSVDVQWGNHDIVWMGAACGSEACIANVLRLSLRYGNTDTLEKGYGINLIPLASFALEHYKEDKSIVFDPKTTPDQSLSTSEMWLNRIMHKAITIIQFKLEEQLVQRRPEFNMADRLFLDKINLEEGVLEVNQKKYPLTDSYLPTLDPAEPTRLSGAEEGLLHVLKASFRESRRLQRHVKFLYETGGLYKVTNANLLYHGCIPLDKEGELEEVSFGDQKFKGKALMDYLEKVAREAFFGSRRSPGRQFAVDMMWYLWAGPNSPLFGKSKMATFERYFTRDMALQAEKKSHYYAYRDNEAACRMILREFGVDPDQGLIVNGHVPVVVKEGENPLKANGKLLVIDGGFAKAYQQQTGIAGYSLIYDYYGLKLIAHEPFESTQNAIENEMDIASSKTIVSRSSEKLRVKDLEDSASIKERVADLKALISSYQQGLIKEGF